MVSLTAVNRRLTWPCLISRPVDLKRQAMAVSGYIRTCAVIHPNWMNQGIPQLQPMDKLVWSFAEYLLHCIHLKQHRWLQKGPGLTYIDPSKRAKWEYRLKRECNLLPQTPVTKPAIHHRLSEQKQSANTQPHRTATSSSMYSMPNLGLSAQLQKRVKKTKRTHNSLPMILVVNVGKNPSRINLKCLARIISWSTC